MEQIKNLVYSMLVENTGIAMMDSGGENGRQWQRNQGKTLKDFEQEPEVTYDEDMGVTISVFHYLVNGLELDALCNEFNALPCEDWESDIYGVSKDQAKWLKAKGFAIQNAENTYNWDSDLSQVLQYTYCALEDRRYVLLQVHGGADVRGGYTDAKLFYLPDEYMPRDKYDQDEKEELIARLKVEEGK